jgi:excisionase family DNA binding protein
MAETNSQMRPDDLLDIQTVANILEVSTRTVSRLLADGQGEIPSVKIGSRRRVRRDDLDEYLRRTKSNPADIAEPKLEPLSLPLIRICGHCGSRSIFSIMHIYSYAGSTWKFMLCSACAMPTLDRTIKLFDSTQGLPHDSEAKILYPSDQSHLDFIPEVIKTEYQAAIRVRNISPDAYAVLARRTLEIICDYEGAVGKTFSDKLEDLIKGDRIPRLLADAAELVRHISNISIHSIGEKVTEEDTTLLMDFLEAIIEYLYVVPAKTQVAKIRHNMIS